MSRSEELVQRVTPAIYPGLVTNHNPGRMPALGFAAAEMIAFGEAYADAIVANARRLAAEIDARGIPVVGRDRGYTASHTVLLRVAEFGPARLVGGRLEQAGIVTTATRLPPALGDAGIRLGLQELTRRGAVPEEMPEIAELIADVVAERRTPDAARARTRDIASRHRHIGYTFDAPPTS
jgi:glycine hydroxymethyltransferase